MYKAKGWLNNKYSLCFLMNTEFTEKPALKGSENWLQARPYFLMEISSIESTWQLAAYRPQLWPMGSMNIRVSLVTY